jgi:hypothetical protein
VIEIAPRRHFQIVALALNLSSERTRHAPPLVHILARLLPNDRKNEHPARSNFGQVETAQCGNATTP